MEEAILAIGLMLYRCSSQKDEVVVMEEVNANPVFLRRAREAVRTGLVRDGDDTPTATGD